MNLKWYAVEFLLLKIMKTSLLKDKEHKPDDTSHYEALCRGELVEHSRVSSQLTCKFIKDKSPFLKIAPFQMEEISLSPYLVKFHNVLYESEIEWLKNIARPSVSIISSQSLRNFMLH